MRRLLEGIALLTVGALSVACQAEGLDVSYPGQDLRMTFLHTTDSHSKVLPFKFVPNVWDERLGILPCPGDDQLSSCQECLGYQVDDFAENPPTPDALKCADCLQFAEAEGVCPGCDPDAFDQEDCYDCLIEVRQSKRCENWTYGGAARVGWVINEERKKALRSAYVDTGDYFQGAPIYNLFTGEAEVRALSAMGCEASVIGNHEFDNGVTKLADMLYRFAEFPVLNANYMWESADAAGSNQLSQLVNPYFIRDYNGLKVGYIGLGNVHSLNSLGDADNSLGVRALETKQALDTYIPMIEHQVDLVVLLSHLGLSGDIEAAKTVRGIDIIFGGHDHIILNPPLEVINPDGETTVVVHSGVNYKAVGRLDVVVRDRNILSHHYTVIPVQSGDEDSGIPPVGEDPAVANVLYDYEFELNRAQNLTREIGVAKTDYPRAAPGDSPLGNLVTDAMRARRGVETDFALTNSLGIRADLPKGPIAVGKIYEIFPFENSIMTMYMSGPELQRLFDYAAGRTAAYGCKTQIQISGAQAVLDCTRGRTKYLAINGIEVIRDYALVQPYIAFSMATNDYIGNGGSGFDVLEQNTTKSNTSLSLRDVVIDFIEEKGEISVPADSGGNYRIELIQ